MAKQKIITNIDTHTSALNFNDMSASSDMLRTSPNVIINNVIMDGTTSRTLAESDAYSYIRHTSNSPITVTVPVNVGAFEMGTEIEFEQSGTGEITFIGVNGVTITSFNSAYTTAGQYATAVLKLVDEDLWILSGLLV